MAEEKKTWYDRAKDKSDKKDKKNPDAGVKNGERAKKITGVTPGSIKRQDPSVASDNRGPRMSPQALGGALRKSAKDATEAAVGPFRWAAQNAGAAKRTGLT